MRWETDQAGNAATRKSLDLNSALLWIRTSQTFALLQTLPFVRNAEGWKKGQDWPEVEEAEGGEGSDEEAGEDDRVGSPCHQLPPPEEQSFQAEKWQLFRKLFLMMTLSSTMMMTYLPMTSLLAVSIGPMVFARRSIRGQWRLWLWFFFSNKVAVLSRQDTHRTPPGGN